jgi:hypothetical protein
VRGVSVMADPKDKTVKPKPSPFERFVHAIANVPKREADEIEEADRRNADGKPKRKSA